EDVAPPFPSYKEMPKLSDELLRRYDGRQVVVYAVINTEGRFEQLTVKDGPTVEVNAPILHALRRWTFRPAQVGGKPVPLKTLLGITLAAFAVGGFEVNPIVSSLTIHFGPLGGVVLSKAIAVLLMLGVRRRLWMVNLVYIGVICWNLVVVISLVVPRH